MRYNEQAVQPPKKPAKEKAAREMTKPGKYDGSHLKNTRDIPWMR